MSFRRVLLNTCQEEFEGAAAAREVRSTLYVPDFSSSSGEVHGLCVKVSSTIALWHKCWLTPSSALLLFANTAEEFLRCQDLLA